MSTFSSLNAATTALWAQRRALDVTGQNIANVNTEGYSRQRVDLQAIGGSVVPAFYSTSTGHRRRRQRRRRHPHPRRLPRGPRAHRARQQRPADRRGRRPRAGRAGVPRARRAPASRACSSTCGPAGRTSPTSPTPTPPAARSSSAWRPWSAVSTSATASLGAQWDQTRENLDVLVDDVNAAASTIAELNKAIQRAKQSGLPANDLADKRDLLVMKLADQVGRHRPARPGRHRRRRRRRHDPRRRAATPPSSPVAGTDRPGPITATDQPRIVTASGSYTVAAGGTAGGQLSTLNTIIPGYRAQLDAIAADLAAAVNAAHTTGFDRAGTAGGRRLGSSTAGRSPPTPSRS